MNKIKKGFIINALRRASYRWPGRYKAFAASKIARNQYVCASCKNIFGKKDVQLDHLDPVVPVEGFSNANEEGWNWEQYLERMFADEDKWQVLCKPCHSDKTLMENQGRKEVRHRKKASKKVTKKGKKTDETMA
jgi:5-methylcytosine-specific restriction endonuclease McrA